MYLLKQTFKKYQFFRLIIWRSLVQAQAGPRKKNEVLTRIRKCFFFIYGKNINFVRKDTISFSI